MVHCVIRLCVNLFTHISDYQVFNETINMTIPVTPTSPPVLVQTVNGWIMIQQKLDASYSFNKSWAEFQV